jgi:hypothetical protein
MILKPSAILLYISGLAYKQSLAKREVRATYLFAALDNIKGANEGVRKTAGENTASHRFGVV